MSRKRRPQNRKGKNRPRPQAPQTPDPHPDLDNAEPMPMVVQHTDRWLHVDEIAERLGVVTRTVRNWGKAGRIPLRRMGDNDKNPLGLAESEFERWLRGEVA